MKKVKPTIQILSVLLLCSLNSSIGFAQVSDKPTTTTPLKTQKYNGYGLPNTKYKKIKVDLTKKKNASQSVASPSIEAAPVKLVPKSSMQPDNTAINTSSTLATAQPSSNAVKPSMIYNVAYNAQMQTQENHSRAEYIQHQFMPKLTLGNYSIFGDFIYTDDIKNPGANEWEDSAVILSRKPFEMGQYFTFGPSVFVGLPLKKSTYGDGGIKYSLNTTAALGLNTKNMGLDKLSLNYTLSYTKYTTEFNTKPNGDPSADYRFRQRINLGYQISDKLSFASRFQYDSGYSNQNVVRNSYYHFESFEYALTTWLAVNITHGTGKAVYTITETADDILFENDLKFYDPRNSEISLGLSLSF